MKKYSAFQSKENSVIDLSKFKKAIPKVSSKLLQSRQAVAVHNDMQVVILLKPKKYFDKKNPFRTGDSLERMDITAFQEKYAAKKKHLEEVINFATHFGLLILSSSINKRTVVVTGTVNQIEKAFNTVIDEYHDGEKTFLSNSKEIGFPNEIAEFIDDVIGLNTKEFDRPPSNKILKSRSTKKQHFIKADDINEVVPFADGFTGAQIAQLYNFPEADGEGQTIGIIELGGGYSDTDLDSYFKDIKIDRPKVIASLVGGAKNVSNPKYDGEVMLDIEVVGAVVPKSTLVVYFAPNSHAGFIQALQAAVYDNEYKPSVISISWGLPEMYWSESNLKSFEQILKDAGTLGITICASSGDQGASDGDTGLNVQYPSSSSSVLSCGGTSITVTKGVITEEEVWETWAGSTGGGFSKVFEIPNFQKNVIPAKTITPLVNRGVPDVAGSANAWTGYYILVNGQKTEKGGTSAVSPLWSGLIARMNQLLKKRLGNIHSELYALNNTKAFNQILKGGNGTYTGGSPWNPCTGLGSPNGTELLNKLKE